MKASKLLSIMTAIWFFVTINSFFTWNAYGPLFHIIPALSVITISLSIIPLKNYGGNKKGVAFVILCWTLWIIIRGHLSANGVIAKFLDFSPLFVILFWPWKNIFDAYSIIRNVFVFYSIGCFIILLFSITGILHHLPYYVLPAQETIHKVAGFHYNVYGVFAVLSKSQVIERNCGMTLEPGHFSIFLGFIYMIERFIGKKGSYVFILGAISTFSPAFFIIFIITELSLSIFSQKKNLRLKYLRSILLFTLLTYFIYLLLPTNILMDAKSVFFERNLEHLLEEFDETSSINQVLDLRASSKSVFDYERLNSFQLLFGGTAFSELLSDYRGLIMQYGIFGLFLSLTIIYSMTKQLDMKTKLIIFSAYILVLLHRSWMLSSPYLYALIFFATALYSRRLMIKNDNYR